MPINQQGLLQLPTNEQFQQRPLYEIVLDVFDAITQVNEKLVLASNTLDGASGQVASVTGGANIFASLVGQQYTLSVVGTVPLATSAQVAGYVDTATSFSSTAVLSSSTTAVTQPAGTSDNKIATTAFADTIWDLPVSLNDTGTAVYSDRGKVIKATTGVQVPASVFAAGHTFSIYNNSAASIDIYAGSGLTLRSAGSATTGSVSIPQRGIATVWFLSPTVAIVSGQLGTASQPEAPSPPPPTETLNLTISSSTTNYNMKSAAIAAGWDQIKVLNLTVTINSGVYIGSASTSSPAFDVGSGFPSGSSLAIVNNGYILGAGGTGGTGGGAGGGITYTGGSGSAGGPALRTQSAVSITNNGVIGGGGGGGGGGGSRATTDAYGSSYQALGGGGGGGQGYFGGGGGPGGTGDSYNKSNGSSGSSGSSTSIGYGGAGGNFNSMLGGAGGNGGSLGSAGGTGETGYSYGGGGGSGGHAVMGNSLITWATTGTRYGTLG